eukprot:TRINITY_DN25399_c0_g1_i1.p1 TRINITY_DN25399_c0_g1~~TRINITY_DN25399_c0_g1_i1.p1  ORF type:complete len:272 (-),score=30.39 TRINITY_DN25399_c0_g1_i1:182-997(-)
MTTAESDGGSFLQDSEDPLWVSVFYGAVTGTVCVLIGYPLDTMKVRLQMGRPFNAALFSKPYRGVLAPLAAVTPSWSANFFLYGCALKWLGDDTLFSCMAAGGVAGIGYAVAVCPFELLKCNTQGSKQPLKETYRRLRAEKGASVLYRGFGACILRDAGQGAAYYGFAEALGRSRYLRELVGEEQAPFVTGMLTGLGHCHVELPFDCIKTRMQTNLAYRSYAEVLQELFKDGPLQGVRGLFRGYLPWMSRAMICHGTSFYAISKFRAWSGL